MAAVQQTIVNELSLDLSQLYDQDDVCQSEEASRELASCSSEQDDMEELVITEAPVTKHSESTRLDLSGLSDSSTGSSGPSLSRDRHTSSTLPSVHHRPFLASEAWTGSDPESGDRSRRTMRGARQGKTTEHHSRTESVDSGRTRIRLSNDSVLKAERLPSVPVANISSKVSPSRPNMPDRGVAFGSTFMRDQSFQSTRLYGRRRGHPRVLPPFLKAHARERRFQSTSLSNDTGQTDPKITEKDTDKIEMPKDFATLHLLARRAQGQMRYRYMAMLNEWIAEHGVPTT